MSPLNITQPLDSIRYMVYNGYYKVMSNIPKMEHLPTPDIRLVGFARMLLWICHEVHGGFCHGFKHRKQPFNKQGITVDMGCG